MVQPSMIEGWGITSIEANASGTPVIAADVPGLRDSVSNPHSGYLVPWGDPTHFAAKINLLIKNPHIRKNLEIESRDWARRFQWDHSADIFNELITAEIYKHADLTYLGEIKISEIK
jgi:glycosyltransferase involved in cell wall biosynthesis